MRERRKLAAQYNEMLAAIPELEWPSEPAWGRSNWQSYCARLPRNCNQIAVMQQLLDVGISTRRGIMCSHREPAYRGIAPVASLLESEAAQDHCVLLPLYPGMQKVEQKFIVEMLQEIVTRRADRSILEALP